MNQPISMLIAFSLTLASFSPPAQAASLVPFGKGTASLSQLGALGLKQLGRMRNQAGEIVYQVADESGKVVRNLIFEKANRSRLAEFQPSKLSSQLQSLRQASGAIVLHKLKGLPIEAFTFFVALGAVATANTIFNASENPAAIDQFLESQKSPLGQIAFASFMVANGLASEPLMALTQSRSARAFIPYLGMSVGMTASTLVHEIGSFPGITKCALSLSLVPKACDEAYAAWIKFDETEKGHEFAAQLFAMVASTLLAGSIEIIGKATLGGTIRAAAVVLTFAVGGPGAVILFRGAMWVYGLAQMVGYTYLDTVTQAPLVFTYKNAIQLGPRLTSASQRLGTLLALKTASDWKPETQKNTAGYPACTPEKLVEKQNCYKDLDGELKDFSITMGKWRQANLENVFTAHTAWSGFLQQLSSQYRTARGFYSDFISDLWKKTFEEKNYVTLMDRSIPLFGVSPLGFDADEMDRLISQPLQSQKAQLETVHEVAVWIQANQNEIQLLKEQLSTSEQLQLTEITRGITSEEVNQVATAIKKMRQVLLLDSASLFENPTQDLSGIVRKLFQKLGNPNPMLKVGQGYLKLLALDANNKSYQTNPFATSNHFYSTPLSTEYLTVQMMMGPDLAKGEKLITSNRGGFPAKFQAPMIRLSGELLSRAAAPQVSATVPLLPLFGSKVWIDGQGGGSLFDFLKNGGVRPEILGDESGSHFADWWEVHADKELAEARLQYELKYDDIIQSFYQKLFRSDEELNHQGTLSRAWKKAFTSEGESFVNRGPVSNGILLSLDQERSVYLAILDQYLRPQKNLRKNLNAANGYSILDAAKSYQSTNETAHEWVQSLLQEWGNVRILLSRLKQKQMRTASGSKTVIVSRISNQEFINQIKKLEELLGQFPLQKTPNAFEERIIQSALKGLKSTQDEILDYAQIINSVSYVENFQAQADQEPVRKRCLGASAARGSAQWLQVQFQGCDK